MSTEETLPKVMTKNDNAPTQASEEDTSTLVKTHRIYSPSKHSMHDFCGSELDPFLLSVNPCKRMLKECSLM
jgi:hypothetical protein